MLVSGSNRWQTTGVKLHALPEGGANAYLAKHGQRAVSAAVRQWVSHPQSVRHCGEPRGGLVPVSVTDKGPRLWSLKQCRNRFVDPYCSGWFRAELASRVEAVTAAHLDSGGDAILLVNTLSHKRGDSLRDVLTWHAKAWNIAQRGKRSADWRELRWCKALDVVVGGRNGPHPHSNTVVLGPAGWFSTDWTGRHSGAWASSVFAAMFKAGAFGFPTKANRQAALEAFAGTRANMLVEGRGVLPVRIDAGNVGMLSRYAVKSVAGAAVEVFDDRHRASRSVLGGFTLMELACMAHDGQEAAGRLLAASAAGLAGRPSYSTSRSWEWLGPALDEDSDAEAVVTDGLIIGMLPAAAYRQHRQAIDSWLDSNSGLDIEASVTAWRQLDADLALGISWLSEPVHVTEWGSGGV